MPLHAAIAAHRFFDQHVEDRDRLVDVGGNRFQQLFAGKGQKLGDQPAAFVDGDLVDFQHARDPRIAGIFGDELVAGLDDRKQIVEIMRDAAGELADHLLLLGLVAILPQRFQLALLRDIADDFHESGGGAVSVMHRLDRRVGPEPLTGFANSPALLFIFSGMTGLGQTALRQQADDIFRRIEAGEMLADDFGPGIAFQLFGADIPGLYMAFEIEAQNSVIVNAVENDLERGGSAWRQVTVGHDGLRLRSIFVVYLEWLRSDIGRSSCPIFLQHICDRTSRDAYPIMKQSYLSFR